MMGEPFFVFLIIMTKLSRKRLGLIMFTPSSVTIIIIIIIVFRCRSHRPNIRKFCVRKKSDHRLTGYNLMLLPCRILFRVRYFFGLAGHMSSLVDSDSRGNFLSLRNLFYGSPLNKESANLNVSTKL